MSLEMNNIKPCFWGKKYWGVLFSMAAVYPKNPDAEYIKHIKSFLASWKKTLPCSGCRESYINFSSQIDTDITNDAYFSSRDKFIILIHKLRNKVNNKIGLEYNITKDYFKLKLDKMCCVDGNDIDGYANEIAEAPFIQEEIKEHIFNYLIKNKNSIENFNSKYTKILMEKNINFIQKPNFDINDKNFKLWNKRNKKCRELINKIYNNMSCGDYGMLESFFRDKIYHIKLFYLGCSIIPITDLYLIFKIKKL